MNEHLNKPYRSFTLDHREGRDEMQAIELDREIIRMLNEGPMLLSELVERLGVSPEYVQSYLDKLMQAGLVVGRKSGHHIIYWTHGRTNHQDSLMAMELINVQLVEEVLNLRREIRNIWQKLDEISQKK